jgi:hypothetical protein
MGAMILASSMKLGRIVKYSKTFAVADNFLQIVETSSSFLPAKAKGRIRNASYGGNFVGSCSSMSNAKSHRYSLQATVSGEPMAERGVSTRGVA